MKKKSLYHFLVLGAFSIAINQTALPSPVATEVNVSPAATRILNRSQRKTPTSTDLRDLKLTDEPFLRKSFENQPLSNRVATAWALAHLGGEAALTTLRKPLEQRDINHPVTAEDQNALLSILWATGYLGQRSDAAVEYLRSRTRRQPWNHVEKWSLEQPLVSPSLMLPASSLVALAMTGKSDTLKEIDFFIEQFSDNEIRPISGLVMDAIFYQWYIQKYGLSALNELLFNGDVIEAVMLFRETTIGKGWVKWKEAKEAVK